MKMLKSKGRPSGRSWIDQDMPSCCKNEKWRPVKGFTGVYIISSCGRLIRLARKQFQAARWGRRKHTYLEMLMSPGIDSLGYHRFILSIKSRERQALAHRLVAEAFLKPNKKPYINHKDSDPKNNHLSNIERCTQTENMRHAKKVGRFNQDGELNHRAKFKVKDILEIRRLASIGISRKNISKKYKTNANHIGAIIRKVSWASI